MKPQRISLCYPVRNTLESMGISTVKLVEAVNAELGKLSIKGSIEEKTGDGKSKEKDAVYSVQVSSKGTYTGKMTIPLEFDTWHALVAKANKYRQFDSIPMPKEFLPWLNKFVPQAQPTTELVTQ